MLGYLAGMSRMNVLLARLVQQGQQIADAFERVLYPAYHLGKAIAEASGTSLLAFLLSALIPFIIAWFVLQHFFISIATTNRGVIRVVYVEKPMKSSSPTRALVKKELHLFFQNPMYMLNSGFGLIFMLALPVVLLVQPSLLAPLLSQYDIPLHLIGMAAVGVMCLLASTVLISAPSISLEGKTLWIARSLPVNAGQVLLSKAYAHIFVCLPVILVSAVVLGLALRLQAWYVFFSLLLPALVAAIMGLTGVIINLKLPKFDWNTPTEAVKQSASVLVAMVFGFALVTLPAALYILVLADALQPLFFMSLYALLLIFLGMALHDRLKHKSARDYLALDG
jgi:ABC-2 type transport system permease protein